jgi:hypothetical protein
LLVADAPTAPVVVAPAGARWQPRSAPWRRRTRIPSSRVYDDTEPYKRAKKGDVVAVAAGLAHEAYHIARQLEVLRALGAKKGDIVVVERAAARFFKN